MPQSKWHKVQQRVVMGRRQLGQTYYIHIYISTHTYISIYKILPRNRALVIIFWVICGNYVNTYTHTNKHFTIKLLLERFLLVHSYQVKLFSDFLLFRWLNTICCYFLYRLPAKLSICSFWQCSYLINLRFVALLLLFHEACSICNFMFLFSK